MSVRSGGHVPCVRAYVRPVTAQWRYFVCDTFCFCVRANRRTWCKLHVQTETRRWRMKDLNRVGVSLKIMRPPRRVAVVMKWGTAVRVCVIKADGHCRCVAIHQFRFALEGNFVKEIKFLLTFAATRCRIFRIDADFLESYRRYLVAIIFKNNIASNKQDKWGM